MPAYIRIIRPVNLLIIAILQSIFYFGLILPVYEKYGIIPLLDNFQFILIIITTLIITGSGYIINDIYDIKTDKINKGKKSIVGKYISGTYARLYYFILIIIGFFTALYIATQINKILYIGFYFMAVSLLYFYSSSLKKTLLWGNVLVSAFSASVLGIILFIEKEGLAELAIAAKEDFYFIFLLLITFIVFSFIVSLSREIVKDIEDMEGDNIIRAKTLPLIRGIEFSKKIVQFLLILTMILLFLISLSEFYHHNYFKTFLILILLLMPCITIIYKLNISVIQKDFYFISQYLKLLMFSSVLILLFYVFSR